MKITSPEADGLITIDEDLIPCTEELNRLKKFLEEIRAVRIAKEVREIMRHRRLVLRGPVRAPFYEWEDDSKAMNKFGRPSPKY